MYSKYNPDPILEVIERRLTPEGKVGQTWYKCRRCGQIINHRECLFCQDEKEDWKKQGLIKQNKVK
jgi:recombinational DNA repair protein RecR